MREVEWTGRVKNAVFFLNLCSDRNRRVLAVWRSMRICGRRPQSKEMFLLSEEGVWVCVLRWDERCDGLKKTGLKLSRLSFSLQSKKSSFENSVEKAYSAV